jgi:GrpB-like predicted nucleotidyltransferase (UPF0157 family)
MNMNKRIIRVVAYDPRWPDLFRIECKAISETLTKEIVHIHHIGSTSVPGLAAKPIIDILLEVKNIKALDAYNPAMEQLGYIPKGEFGIPGRRFFLKGIYHRTHHIHAFNAGSHDVLRHIAFRDYLIAHPKIAKEYGDLKLKYARACENDIDKYSDMKHDYIKYHEEKAMQWVA